LRSDYLERNEHIARLVEQVKSKSPHTKREVVDDEPQGDEPKGDDSFAVVENIALDRQGLSFGATAIYSYMARLCWYDKAANRHKDTCYVSLATLADRFACIPRTVASYIDELVSQKLIKRIRRGKMVCNKYQLTHRIGHSDTKK
jgi:hypothetical protein